MRDILRKIIRLSLKIIASILIFTFALELLNQSPIEEGEGSSRISKGGEPTVKKEVRIPDKEDIESLRQTCNEVIEYLQGQEVVLDDITELYNQVQEAKVCRKANKRFNELSAKYSEYKTQLDEIQEHISKFVEEYNTYMEMLESIPSYAKTLKEEKYAEFERELKSKCEPILNESQKYDDNEELITNMYLEAKKIADDFFEEYYELMCQLVVGEAGNGDLQEQSRIINVAENRVEHPAFKYYTIKDVMFAPGQYECTWNGGIYKTQSEQLRENVRAYLRGEVETGMPDDVVWQAKFPQGSRKDDPWFYNEENGHYFCYY